MQLVHLILPSLATIALGSALLMPHREDKPKRTKRSDAGLDGAARATNPLAAAIFERYVGQSPGSSQPAGAADAASDELGSAAHPEALARDVVPDDLATVESRSAVVRMSSCEDLAARDFDPMTPAANPLAAVASQRREEGCASDERVVPLTRHRLRRQPASVDWPSLIDSSRTACGPEERAALLRSIDTLTQGDVRERVLLEALDEEAGELRLVALRSLAQSPSTAGARAFADILVHGADEERALAIDALLAIDQREALVPAFGDRVEAIAAKAVFAYVGSRRRTDYVDLLATRFEHPRREAILTLLAGALE